MGKITFRNENPSPPKPKATLFKRLFRALLFDICPEENGDIRFIFSDGERKISKEQADHVLHNIFR